VTIRKAIRYSLYLAAGWLLFQMGMAILEMLEYLRAGFWK